jgi:hypothetical protein
MHSLEEARPRCPILAFVRSTPWEHPCLTKDEFSTVRSNRSSFAESCVDAFLFSQHDHIFQFKSSNDAFAPELDGGLQLKVGFGGTLDGPMVFP